MTKEQIKVLKSLKKQNIDTKYIPASKEEDYCFLHNQKLAYLITGRKNEKVFDYYQISPLGKSALEDERHRRILFWLTVLGVLLSAIAAVTGIISLLK